MEFEQALIIEFLQTIFTVGITFGVIYLILINILKLIK